MFWIFPGVGVLLILLGFAVHKLNWHVLIAGYNTMTKEEQAKVDVKGLSRLLGIFSYVNGAAFILCGILQELGIKGVLLPTFALLGVSLVYMTIKAQTYNRNLFDEQGKLVKGAGMQLAIPFVIMGTTIIFVIVLLVYASQDAKITFFADGVKIHGMYGARYTWDSITAVELRDDLPTIEMRTNGSAVGSHLKGRFRTTEMGDVKLIVNIDRPPFVYLSSKDGVVIFNLADPNQTREAFQKIDQQVGTRAGKEF